MAWLTNWNYRKAITISNAGSALSDYQVLITVDTATLISAGKMQSDCRDIRLTNDDGSTPLNYWIESGQNTVSTKIWVKISSILAGANTMYVYYGNTSVSSASNGTNVFIAFDDFERGTTMGGSLFATPVEYISTVQKIGSYSACDPGDVGGCCGGFASNNVSVTANTFVMGWSYYMPTAKNSKEFVNNHSWFGFSYGANLMYYISGWNDTGIPLATGTWMKFEYQAPTASTCKIRRIDNGGNWMGPFGTRYTLSTMNYYMRSAYSAGPAYLDNCYIRKYVTTEPTTLLGSEETPANITTTLMTITPSETPCRVGICTVTVNVTWTNNGGTSGDFIPNITIDGTPYSSPYPLQSLGAGLSVIKTFTISGLAVGTRNICPYPN